MRTFRSYRVLTLALALCAAPARAQEAPPAGQLVEGMKCSVDPSQTYDVAKLLQNQRGLLNDVRRSPEQPGLLYIYVQDASEALPQIFSFMNEHPEFPVQQADKYMPPFDDVFIRLMEQADNTDV